MVFLEEVFSKAVKAMVVIVKERISAGLAALAFAIVKSISVAYVLHVLLKSFLARLRRGRSIPKCIERNCPPSHSTGRFKVGHELVD